MGLAGRMRAIGLIGRGGSLLAMTASVALAQTSPVVSPPVSLPVPPPASTQSLRPVLRIPNGQATACDDFLNPVLVDSSGRTPMHMQALQLVVDPAAPGASPSQVEMQKRSPVGAELTLTQSRLDGTRARYRVQVKGTSMTPPNRFEIRRELESDEQPLVRARGVFRATEQTEAGCSLQQIGSIVREGNSSRVLLSFDRALCLRARALRYPPPSGSGRARPVDLNVAASELKKLFDARNAELAAQSLNLAPGQLPMRLSNFMDVISEPDGFAPTSTTRSELGIVHGLLRSCQNAEFSGVWPEMFEFLERRGPSDVRVDPLTGASPEVAADPTRGVRRTQ